MEIPENTIINVINKAIIETQNMYKKSTEQLICFAPEYLITASIYSALTNIKNTEGDTGVTVEESLSNIKCQLRGGERLRGRKPSQQDNGRCDVVLWNSKNIPRVVIEVKRNTSKKECEKDIKRLSSLLKYKTKLTKNRLEFCIYACCIHEEIGDKGREDAEDKLDQRISRLRSHAEKNLKNHCLLDLTDYEIQHIKVFDAFVKNETNNWLWRPLCFVINHK
jgi:hypothetical protein